MYQFTEKGMREQVSYVVKIYSKANNKNFSYKVL